MAVERKGAEEGKLVIRHGCARMWAGAIARLPLPVIWLLTRLPLIVLALALGSLTDATYLHYGQAMVKGAWPYRDFGVEYPPLAMAFLALPALAAHALSRLSPDSYAVFFGLEALLLDALFCTVFARAAGRRAVVWYLLLTMVGGSLLQTFDLLPAALAATAVVLRQRGRDRHAWLVLAAAAASKGWPLVLVPLFLVLDREHPRRLAANLGLAVLVFAALIAPGLLGGLKRAEEGLAFHAQRAPEVETLYANLAMVAHAAFGVPARVFVGGAVGVPEAHSSDVISALPGWAALPHLVLIALLAIGYLCTLPHLRRTPGALPGSAALLVGLFMVGFSVLETQYFLWLAPLAAMALSRGGTRTRDAWALSGIQARAAAFLVLFALLSHVLRFQWDHLLAMQPGAVAVATIRNACLLLALGVLWRAHLRTSRRQDVRVVARSRAPRRQRG